MCKVSLGFIYRCSVCNTPNHWCSYEVADREKCKCSTWFQFRPAASGSIQRVCPECSYHLYKERKYDGMMKVIEANARPSTVKLDEWDEVPVQDYIQEGDQLFNRLYKSANELINWQERLGKMLREDADGPYDPRNQATPTKKSTTSKNKTPSTTPSRSHAVPSSQSGYTDSTTMPAATNPRGWKKERHTVNTPTPEYRQTTNPAHRHNPPPSSYPTKMASRIPTHTSRAGASAFSASTTASTSQSNRASETRSSRTGSAATVSQARALRHGVSGTSQRPPTRNPQRHARDSSGGRTQYPTEHTYTTRNTYEIPQHLYGYSPYYWPQGWIRR